MKARLPRAPKPPVGRTPTGSRSVDARNLRAKLTQTRANHPTVPPMRLVAQSGFLTRSKRRSRSLRAARGAGQRLQQPAVNGGSPEPANQRVPQQDPFPKEVDQDMAKTTAHAMFAHKVRFASAFRSLRTSG